MANSDAPSGMKNQNRPKKTTGLELTAREMQCVTQAVQNKTLAEIAENLGVKPESVYFYLNNVQQKIINLNHQILK